MRRCFTAVLEQGTAFSADFETEAFEGGWASEACWFVRFLEGSGEGLEIEFQPEVSPDGLIWCAAKGPPTVVAAPLPELVTFDQARFGNWLRLRVRLRGAVPYAKVVIYLVLKE